MPLRPAILLIFLSLTMSGVCATVSTLNEFHFQGQETSKKPTPTPTPTPPPDGPNPGDPGGPGNTVNEILRRSFKAGNEALSAANLASKGGNSDGAIQGYTAAIGQYDEGLALDAEQPAILTNKAVALKGRGVERFNAAVRSKTLDEAGRSIAIETAKQDFKAAAESATKAVTLLKRQPVPTDPAELGRYNANKYAVLLTNAEAVRLYVSKVDHTQIEAGIAAFREYIAVETDPAQRTRAQLNLAQMLLDSGAADRALVEFKAILATQPDNPDANLGAGFALYASGDKANFSEAAGYFQHFIEVTPDTNAMKADAKAMLGELKAERINPEKSSKPTRIRP